jgi:single-stranded-DNA-specific exonuclease
MSDLVIEQRVARCAPIAEIDPLLARLFASRGVKDKAQLDLSLQNLHPPAALAQITRAATRLQTALKEQQKLIIIGDFDADGATATTLAVSLLTALGAHHVEYLVPNRFEFGYGLTPEIVALAIAESGDEKPDVIITVDKFLDYSALE